MHKKGAFENQSQKIPQVFMNQRHEGEGLEGADIPPTQFAKEYFS